MRFIRRFGTYFPYSTNRVFLLDDINIIDCVISVAGGQNAGYEDAISMTDGVITCCGGIYEDVISIMDSVTILSQ